MPDKMRMRQTSSHFPAEKVRTQTPQRVGEFRRQWRSGSAGRPGPQRVGAGARVERIAGLSACLDSAFALTKVYSSKYAESDW